MEEHEFKVEKIEENAISTHDNIRGGNEKLSFAVQSARNARKWKWWILLVCSKFSTRLSFHRIFS